MRAGYPVAAPVPRTVRLNALSSAVDLLKLDHQLARLQHRHRPWPRIGERATLRQPQLRHHPRQPAEEMT
jgi:hypothetical protein